MPSITIAGREVLFDELDQELIDSREWRLSSPRPNQYVQKMAFDDSHKRICVLLHRLIMDAPEGFVVDHINGNTLDNRRANLRICSQAQNLLNRKIHSNNRSGYKGVYYDPECRFRPWRADIRANGKRVRLGFFKTPEEAHSAYVDASKRLHGEFARAS